MISQTCREVVYCSNARGHIIINGYQYSISLRGLNIVLYDYRSGLYEHSIRYDNNEYTALSSFLNGLSAGKILFMVVARQMALDANSASALQRFGVSATYATASLPHNYFSMATIAYTGQERKSWEKSVNKEGGQGTLTLQQKIYLFRELNGRDECSQEMGARNGKIPNSAFTAASSWNSDYQAHFARLHITSGGWCSASGSPLSDYLQIDLGTVKIVTGVAIQGQGGIGNGVHYITQFNIKYSTDHLHWHYYTGIGSNAHVFGGVRRQQRYETRVNWFQRTMARYLRIIPTARSTTTSTCIRLEFYGCIPEATILQTDNFKSQLFTPYKYHNIPLSVYASVPEASNIVFGISSAADNKALAEDIQQTHIYSLRNVTKFDRVKMTKIRNESNNLVSSLFYQIDFSQSDYCALNMKVSFRVNISAHKLLIVSWTLGLKKQPNSTTILFLDFYN